MSESAKRVERHSDVDDARICYWNTEYGWMLYIPGCGVGTLGRDHAVIEHEDGTITVTPSVLMTGHKNGRQVVRHGFLIKGIWSDC